MAEEAERDERKVDLLGVPMWLARPLFEDDKRLEWIRHDEGAVARLTAVDESVDDPQAEVRKAAELVWQRWMAFQNASGAEMADREDAFLGALRGLCIEADARVEL